MSAMGMSPMIGNKIGPLATLQIAVLFSGILSQATAASVAEVEIRQLLGYVERSGCVVSRNGSWYSASDARAHLEKKYRISSIRDGWTRQKTSLIAQLRRAA